MEHSPNHTVFPAMRYDPSISLTLEQTSHPLQIESRFVAVGQNAFILVMTIFFLHAPIVLGIKSLPPLLSPVTQHVPSLSFLPAFLSDRNSCLNNVPRPLSVEPPLPQRNKDRTSGQMVVFSASIANTMRRTSPLTPNSPHLPAHSIPQDSIPANSETPTDCGVKPRPALLTPASSNILKAQPSHEPAQLTVDLPISPDFEDDTSLEAVESAKSVQSNLSSPLSSPAQVATINPSRRIAF